MPNSPELKFALQTVRQATALVAQVQREMVTPALTKDDRSPVTVGDYAAQALVAARLREAFPQDLLVGEESADALQQAEGQATLTQVARFVTRLLPEATEANVCQLIQHGAAEPGERFWTLDPIDGTKGFLRGEQYAVCLALVEQGAVRLGVLGCPQLGSDGQPVAAGESGTLLYAVAGQGAWSMSLASEPQTPEQIRISDRTDPREARLLRSVEAGHTHGGKIEDLVQALGVEAEPVRLDSQAKYAVLARGQGDLLVRLLSPSRPDYREKIWDQAAGSLVVQEAGGQVTDLDGKPLDFSQGRTLAANRGVLASNGHLHQVTLEALEQIGA